MMSRPPAKTVSKTLVRMAEETRPGRERVPAKAV